MRTPKTYSDKLRDPRWQRKRLEVLQQHGFKCDMCGCKDDELHVHHINYHKGADPWEYQDNEFKVFCKLHHEIVEDTIRVARHAISCGLPSTIVSELDWVMSETDCRGSTPREILDRAKWGIVIKHLQSCFPTIRSDP
jgi:hypothetical protein